MNNAWNEVEADHFINLWGHDAASCPHPDPDKVVLVSDFAKELFACV
jgi:hypothetical protein